MTPRKHYPSMPSTGQTTLWVLRPPRESSLLGEILFRFPRILWRGNPIVDLARHPAGAWIAARRGHDGGLYQTGYVTGAPAGWADISGFVPQGLPKRAGAHVAIEVKRSPTEELRPEQIEHLTRVRLAGGIPILACTTWEDALDEYLDAVGLRRLRSEARMTLEEVP